MAAELDPRALISARGIVKEFPGVRALRGVDFDVAPGEVHALVGENGAGKSTLMNVLAGVLAPDRGEIAFDGRPCGQLDPVRAHRLGIGFVRQEPTVLPELTVLENMTLGAEARRLGLLESSSADAWALACLERVQLHDDPAQLVERLSIAQRHLLDVAKTLFHRPRLLIMDEPTATLTAAEADWLFAIIDAHVADGGSVVYISHRLDEVFRLARRATVLRDGELVATVDVAGSELDEDDLIAMMVGRRLEAAFPERVRAPEHDAPSADATRLTVRGLLRDVTPAQPDLELRGGEVLGIAGLVGSGRTELVEALFGVNPALQLDVELDGRPLALGSPAAAAAAGIALVPEDRRKQGLVGVMSVGENLTMAVPGRVARGGWIRRRRERELTEHYMRELAIKAYGPGQEVATLSGGNQQKVVIAKWIAHDSKVFIFDEPTKGVDVGARVEIYRQIAALAADGKVVIVVSSELSEVLGLSDQVLIMHQGAPAARLRTADADAERVLRAAFGRSE